VLVLELGVRIRVGSGLVSGLEMPRVRNYYAKPRYDKVRVVRSVGKPSKVKYTRDLFLDLRHEKYTQTLRQSVP